MGILSKVEHHLQQLHLKRGVGLFSRDDSRVLMSHGYIRVLCMLSHYCVTVSNIWASMELVEAGINWPVFTKKAYLFVEGWLFTHLCSHDS